MIKNKELLLDQAKGELEKSLVYLDYSFQKTKTLNLTLSTLEDNLLLETLEALVARFSRTTDIFLSRYIRTYVLIQEPGFRGTTLDFLNQAEKLNLISSVATWAEIKELRNSAAHEYLAENLLISFKKIIAFTPLLLSLKALL